MKDTKIEWAHHTFNAWWGCTKVSEGCTNCYASVFDKRVGGDHWGPDAERRLFGEKHWAEPLKWDRAAAQAGEHHRVFCSSMADVFEGRPDLYRERQKLWKLIRETPNLDWLLLTKRPENILRIVPWSDPDVPLPRNVWLGCTAENQRMADARIPVLLRTPAVLHFLSVEPLLEQVDLRRYLSDPDAGHRVSWVIVGGESGPKSRPCSVGWVRHVLSQCEEAGVPCFVKQLGQKSTGLVSSIRDPKGGDMAEWPLPLRVRQVPQIRAY